MYGSDAVPQPTYYYIKMWWKTLCTHWFEYIYFGSSVRKKEYNIYVSEIETKGKTQIKINI